MIPRALKLSEFITEPIPVTYKEWKPFRKSIVKVIGQKLLQLEEPSIRLRFEEWEISIREFHPEKMAEDQMAILLAISILHFFQRNLNIIRTFSPIINEFLQCSNANVFTAASKTLYWIANENQEGSQLLSQPVNMAFSWLKTQKSDLIPNAMCIFKYAKGFPEVNLAHRFTSSFDYFFQVSMSNDMFLRSSSISIIDFVLRNISIVTYNAIFRNYFRDSMKIIENDRSPKAHGAILILNTLYDLIPDLFSDSHKEISQSLLDLSKNEYEPLAIDSIKFWLFIGSKDISFFAYDVNQSFLDVLFDRCTKANKCDTYYKLIEDSIYSFRDRINIQAMVEYLEKVLRSNNTNIDPAYAFQVLSCVIERYPTSSIDFSIFMIDFLPDAGIQCLKLLPYIDKDILQYLGNCVKKGLSINADERTQVQALKIARTFDSELFQSKEELYQAISPLFDSKNEEVLLEVVRTVSLVDTEESLQFMLISALYDQYESVRHEALALLKPSPLLATDPLLQQILAESSIEMKKQSIGLIADMMDLNPLILRQSIISLVEDILASILSINHIRHAADLASLLPILVSKLPRVLLPYAQSIIVACINCMYPNIQPIKSEQCLFSYSIQSVKRDLKTTPLRDGFALVPKPSEPGLFKNSLYRIMNQKDLDRRDMYLLQTIAMFPRQITPFLDNVLMVFYRIFTERNNDSLIEIAAGALTKITMGVGNGLNLRLYCPQFIPVLTKILRYTHSQKVSIAILQLLGTAVDNYGYDNGHSIENDLPLTVDLINSSYYTDFALSHLSKFFNNPSDDMLEAVTRIFESSPKDSAKFAEEVIHMFIRTINETRKQQRAKLFAHLEQITSSCPYETIPFLPELTKCLLENVSDSGCMLLCSCLSFTFKTTFTPYAKTLYIAGLECLRREENFAETMKFLTFAVCFQNQPLSLLLDVVEELIAANSLANSSIKVSKNLCFIVQTIDISMFQARIARIVRVLYSNSLVMDDPFAVNLAYSLVVACRMSKQLVKKILPPELDCSEILENLKNNKFDFKDYPYIDIMEMRFLPTHVEIPSKKSAIEYFDNLTVPTELGVSQWLDGICQVVITSSPSPVVRSCASFVERQKQFRSALFPVAFLSCWEVATKSNREKFSSIISTILKEHKRVNQIIFHIAEITDRALLPINVSYIELSKKCESKELSLYFLQKEHQRDPQNFQVVEMLLELNSSMGRTISAQGLLHETNTSRDKKSSARWNEWLGDWQHALDLYENNDQTFSNRIRCHAHLQQWDKIRELEPEFWKLSKADKAANARHFAWAFYHTEDWQKVAKILPTFSNNPSLTDLIFQAVFALRQNHLDESKQLVEKGFNKLAKDRSIYAGGDISKATYNLKAAQLFVEISEACRIIQEKKVSSLDVWTRRLKGFQRDGDTWIKLIDIRSLIISPEENFGVYLKMLSVLREEGRWDIIDGYLAKLKGRELPPDIVLARAKIEYARGREDIAIQTLEKIKKREIDPVILAKIDRTLAKYYQQVHPNQMQKVADLYSEAKDLCSVDAHAWTGWAYTNHALAQTSTKHADDYAIAAVSGFMGAVQLGQTGIVEYLVLLFAIFFKIKDSSKITDDLIEDLLALPQQMIAQVVPQITVQIAHQDMKIRSIVHQLLTKFGNDHFQCIMFPLGMYTYSKNEKDKAIIAKDIINSLQKRHKEENNDAEIFVQGMLDAALTPFEKWVLALDEAAYAKREGNTKKINEILSSLFKSMQNLKSDLDKRFVRMHGQGIAQAQQLFRKGTEQANASMWELLKMLYDQFLDKTNKLEIILLPRVNEELAVKRNFTISIPGTYSVNHPSPLIHSVEPALQVLGTQQHPRILYLVSDSGKKVKFLLKGSEDLRLDQRVMQFFNLVNSLLQHDAVMGEFKSAQIVEYPIIPLAPTAGLITWVENADTLHQMICDMRSAYKTSQVPEFEILRDKSNNLFPQLTSLQRLEMFYEITQVCPGNEVRDFLWYKAPNASAWLQTQNNFCTTTALMSMIGYIIGLGDRHPSNIMVQRNTGRVVHIDFGDTFETTINRASFPEKVPFRLTRMIVNALDGGTVEGLFKQMCINIMVVLRANKSSLVALLEIFIHEPLENNASERSGHQTPTKSIARVSDKLNGRDMMEEFGRELDVSEQVSVLIRDASDCTKYITHYTGWCPYW